MIAVEFWSYLVEVYFLSGGLVEEGLLDDVGVLLEDRHHLQPQEGVNVHCTYNVYMYMYNM